MKGPMSQTAQQARDSGVDENGPGLDRVDAAVRLLPRRRFFSDMPDKGLFAFVAVFGFPVIIALKVYEYDARIVAAFAVALMLGYGVIAYRLQAVQLRLDRLGDNFYYLGFIYTLASMSAALLQLNQGLDLDAILGSFGIALFTTIIGVAGRVLFVQLRSEIDEIEAVVRRDLLAASNDLKSQMSLSLREFETFHRSVLQVSSESVVKATQAAELQIDLIRKIAKSSADQVHEALEKNHKVAVKIDEAIKRIAESADRLTEQHKRENVVKATQAGQLQIDLIAKIAKTATDQVHEAFQKNHRSATKIDEAIKTIAESVNRLAEQLEQVFARLRSIGAEMNRTHRGGRRRWYWPFLRRSTS
jgi:hypothetical protein